jgi:hypothetical protein
LSRRKRPSIGTELNHTLSIVRRNGGREGTHIEANEQQFSEEGISSSLSLRLKLTASNRLHIEYNITLATSDVASSGAEDVLADGDEVGRGEDFGVDGGVEISERCYTVSYISIVRRGRLENSPT